MYSAHNDYTLAPSNSRGCVTFAVYKILCSHLACPSSIDAPTRGGIMIDVAYLGMEPRLLHRSNIPWVSIVTFEYRIRARDSVWFLFMCRILNSIIDIGGNIYRRLLMPVGLYQRSNTLSLEDSVFAYSCLLPRSHNSSLNVSLIQVPDC